MSSESVIWGREWHYGWVVCPYAIEVYQRPRQEVNFINYGGILRGKRGEGSRDFQFWLRSRWEIRNDIILFNSAQLSQQLPNKIIPPLPHLAFLPPCRNSINSIRNSIQFITIYFILLIIRSPQLARSLSIDYTLPCARRVTDTLHWLHHKVHAKERAQPTRFMGWGVHHPPPPERSHSSGEIEWKLWCNAKINWIGNWMQINAYQHQT